MSLLYRFITQQGKKLTPVKDIYLNANDEILDT
jgi:hypothetical protein